MLTMCGPSHHNLMCALIVGAEEMCVVVYYLSQQCCKVPLVQDKQ